MYAAIASFAISFAFLIVRPYVTHPGNAGTSTVNPPSGSGRNMILK